MALLYKILVRTAAAVALIAITIYAVWAQGSRRMGDLRPEHRVDLESEFVAQQESDTDWAAYLAIEDALARELEDEVDSKERRRSKLDRHWHKSWTHPDNFGTNWNRSYD